MEAAGGAESLIDKIKPPRLEDAGLEDCALPPESIKEAFLKAASAVRSIVTDSDDEGRCVEDPWEDSTDALVGISDGVSAPTEGCVVEKGGGLTEAPGDKLVVGGGLPEGGDACIDGLQGMEIGGKGRGNLGKKLLGGNDDVGDEEENGDNKPTLAEGYI